MNSRRTAIAARVGLAVASLAIVVGVLEYGARFLASRFAPVRLRDDVFVTALPRVQGVARPEWSDVRGNDPLPTEKPADEVRVFVFGESSIEGVPLSSFASPPTMLHDLLTSKVPSKRMVVVNMGRTGSNAVNAYYYLLDAARYQPDFLIFYLGMNDSMSMGGEQCVAATAPAAHRAWRFLVERSRLLWAVRVFSPVLFAGNEQRVGGSAGAPCDAAYFEAWAKILVEAASSTGARVLVTTPVRSLSTAFEPDARFGDVVRLDPGRLPSGYRHLVRCRLDPACDFGQAMADASASGGWMALRMLGIRHPALAGQKAFVFHTALQWWGAASVHGGIFIDFKSALEARSPLGLLGAAHFSDEIHLTVEGYHFLAQHWARAIGSVLYPEIASIAPEMPSAAAVQRYFDTAGTNGLSMLMSFLARGWILTAVPGFQQAIRIVSKAEDNETAELVLAWLRRGVGLPDGLPPTRRPLLEAFDPYAWKP